MYKQINNFYRCYNRDDFISFVAKAKNDFDSIEDSEYWFGYSLAFNEDTGENLETVEEWAKTHKFKYEPESYPCTIFYLNELDFGRCVDEQRLTVFYRVEDKQWCDYDDSIPTRKEGSE